MNNLSSYLKCLLLISQTIVIERQLVLMEGDSSVKTEAKTSSNSSGSSVKKEVTTAINSSGSNVKKKATMASKSSASNGKNEAKTASNSKNVTGNYSKTLDRQEQIRKQKSSDEQKKYNQFFNQSKKLSLKEIVEMLNDHQIDYNQDYSYDKDKDTEISLEIKSENLNFITLRANVTIGPFSTSFLINYDFKDDYIKEEEDNPIVIGKEIGKGSYGHVHMSITRQDSIVKRIKFSKILSQTKLGSIRQLCRQMQNYQLYAKGSDQNEETRLRRKRHEENEARYREYQAQILANLQGQLLLSIKEVFFLKIASALQIAPKIYKICDAFDFLISQHGFLFQMEICHSNIKRNITEQMEVSLKKKLFRLHSLRIVHRDIKPENILVNRSNQPFFIDFGGCDLLQNQQNTDAKYYMTVYSPLYCHPKIMDLVNENKGEGWGNLYFYDLHSLQKVLEQNRPYQKSKKDKNQYKYQISQQDFPTESQLKKCRLEEVKLREAKKYIYAYLLTLNSVSSRLQDKKNRQKQKDISVPKIKQQDKKNIQPLIDRSIKMKEYLSIASKDRVFIENITVIHHCSSNWSKSIMEKQFNLSALCVDNLPYLQSLRQRIQNQCVIKISLGQASNKLKYLQKLASVKMVDIWSNIEFDSLPLMRLYTVDFRKFSVQTLMKTLKADSNPNNSIVDKMSAIIYLLNFKTKRYGVSFQQKVDIIFLIAHYLADKFVKQTDSHLEVIKKGLRFLIRYYEKYSLINESHLATGYLTLLSNCVILQAYEREDWQRWYNKLVDESASFNFKLLNSMKLMSVYFCQYSHPFNQNSLIITDIAKMILQKLKQSEKKSTDKNMAKLTDFMGRFFQIVSKTDSAAEEYDLLCVQLQGFTFFDIVVIQQCIKVVGFFKTMICLTGEKKSQAMGVYCQGNSRMQYNDMIFFVLVFELYTNNQKRLRNQLSNIDSIIDCAQISANILLFVRLHLSLQDKDVQKTRTYLGQVERQLFNVYNHNNYMLLSYLKSILTNKARNQQILGAQMDPIGQQFDAFITLNIQHIQKLFLKANKMQQDNLDMESIIKNFDMANQTFLELVEDYIVGKKIIKRKKFNYQVFFDKIRFFQDFAQSDGQGPHGKYSLMFRMEKLSKRDLEGFSCILKCYQIQKICAKKIEVYEIDQKLVAIIKEKYSTCCSNSTLTKLFFRSSTSILYYLIINRLQKVDADIGECLQFIQQFVDVTNFSKQHVIQASFSNLKLMCVSYFYKGNEQEDLRFQTVKVNFIKLAKMIIAKADLFKDDVLSSVSIFMPIYAYAFKLKINLEEIWYEVTEEQQFMLSMKIKSMLLRQQNRFKVIYPFYCALLKEINIINQYHRLQRIDKSDTQLFQKEKKRMLYLIARYANKQGLTNMMKGYIPQCKNLEEKFGITLKNQHQEIKKEISNAVSNFILKNKHRL